MTHRLKNLWEAINSSLWFLPSIMTIFALCLAFGSVTLDNNLDGGAGWAYGGGAEGARKVLAAIAASMITVAGVAFSIMIVALTLASQQFGPRLLRNFMRDTGNQVVLGTFIATFTYCLIVLRTIRSTESEFVPHVSVSLAILFALASLGVLIFFIHHAAMSIQAPEVIAMVAGDLTRGIDRLFPEKFGNAPPEEDDDERKTESEKDFERHADRIRSQTTGYLQSVDNGRLMTLAAENDLVLRLPCRPGDFIVEGDDLIQVHPRGRVEKDMIGEIQDSFIFNSQRTHLQDIEFTLNQLVEVAVRALSPGINDPTTAISCIDRIAAALCRLAERSMPAACRYDESKRLRVIVARPVRFNEVVDHGFDSIRRNARSSASVTFRLLEVIELIARRVRTDNDRRALVNQAIMIERGSHDGLFEERDREKAQKLFDRAMATLRKPAWRETSDQHTLARINVS